MSEKAPSDDLVPQRVLLKLSGEVLSGGKGYGIDPDTLLRLARDIQQGSALGFQICLVIGGGNIFRGSPRTSTQLDRVTADHIGMLATVMNSLALQGTLEWLEMDTRVLSSIPMSQLCEFYARRRALRHLEKGRIVIFAGGTGNPFFSTDTAAALRASEMNCQVLLKGTKVDGVYDEDPHLRQSARRYARLSYREVIERRLQVMDTAAFALAQDNQIPIIVFSIKEAGSFTRALTRQGAFTIIDAGSEGTFAPEGE